jgi:hypothetical protein
MFPKSGSFIVIRVMRGASSLREETDRNTHASASLSFDERSESNRIGAIKWATQRFHARIQTPNPLERYPKKINENRTL